MNIKRWIVLAATLAAVLPGAQAQSKDSGDWLVRVRALHLNSANKDSTGLDLSVENRWFPELDISYFFTPNLAAELVLTYPQKHDIRSNGTKIGTLKHLPPTLTLQYYFLPESKVNPFLGVGANYTLTFSEKERGALTGTNTKVGDSFGIAAQAGLVFNIADQWDIVADARWMDIDASVKVDGTKVGTTHVDPLIFGLHLGYRF